MTQKQLDDIKARSESAVCLLDNIIHAECDYEVYTGLIESAQDIPDLLAEIERLRALTTWIPCSERMPERKDASLKFGLIVLVWSEMRMSGYISDYRDVPSHYTKGLVSHWMPLPEEPEEATP